MDNKLLLLLAVGMILLALLIVLVDRRRTKKTMDTIEPDARCRIGRKLRRKPL